MGGQQVHGSGTGDSGGDVPVVPGFTLVRRVGEGGSGRVWSARRAFDSRLFALKVVSCAEEESRAQAMRELTVLSALRVDHVVRLHAALPLPDGGIALVLDLLDGGSLGDVVYARGHLYPGEVVTALAPVCRAVADLHARGVVHGDLSPANVLFTGEGRPMVTDLGVAALAGRPEPVAFGTPGFVAPEVLDGDPPSEASDVYGLGALVWHALVGRPPSPLRVRPSLADELPGLPPDLAALVDECLRELPEDRPAAAAVALRLFDSATAVPVQLSPGSDPTLQVTNRVRRAAALDSTGGRPARRPARHRRARRGAPGSSRVSGQGTTRRRQVAAAITAVLAVLAFGSAGIWWGTRDAGPAVADARPSVPAGSVPAEAASTSSAGTPTASRTARPTASATAGHATPVSDRDAPRSRPRDLLQRLSDLRADALVRRDPAALGRVFVAGSAADAADRATIAALVGAGATYQGLRLPVATARLLDWSARVATLRSRVDTSSYLTVSATGDRARRPARVGADLVVDLRWTDGGWRIAAVRRA